MHGRIYAYQLSCSRTCPLLRPEPFKIANLLSKQVKKPSNLSFAEAASIPLAGLTAYTVLIKQGGIKAGSRVLVNGSSGGVGVMAVQIAKAVGAYVVATCSEQSASLVKGLGADETVDYRQSDFLGSLAHKYGSETSRFDLVFDVSECST